MRKIRMLLLLSFLVILTSCATQADLDASYDAGYRDGESHGYNEGYEYGYEEGEEDALYNLQDTYINGKLVYMTNEALEDLLFMVEEKNGFEYQPEEYIIEVEKYFDAHKFEMSSDEIETFENILTYLYDAEWLTRRIAYGK